MAFKTTETSILIVDDDKATIDMLSMLLKKNGYEVGTAFNGEEALDFLRKRAYDIIITDLKMPKIDGYQLLDIVRTSYRNHKVLVMTADLFKKEKLLRKGAMEAFSKPFNLKILIEELNILLKERRRTKRFSSKEKVHCLIKDKRSDFSIEGIVVDISIDGVLINISQAVRQIDEISIDFMGPDNSRSIGTMSGKVVRISKMDNAGVLQMAVYFEDERDLALLEKLGKAIHPKETLARTAV